MGGEWEFLWHSTRERVRSSEARGVQEGSRLEACGEPDKGKQSSRKVVLEAGSSTCRAGKGTWAVLGVRRAGTDRRPGALPCVRGTGGGCLDTARTGQPEL